MPGRSQRGQILVVFAGGLILLLAVVALVIDLGFVWMTRRHQQNAADPGALAAARYIVPTPDHASMVRAACFYAQQNGYFSLATSLDECDAAHDPGGASLTVNYPPSAAAGQYAGRAGYVEVIISQPQNAFFAGVVGLRQFVVSTSAVAAYDVGNSNSASLLALNPANCPQGGGTITGGAQVSIFPATGVTGPGGYVQVDSNCATGPPDNICGTGSGQGGLNVNGTSMVSAPQVDVVGTCTGGGTIESPLGGNPLVEGAPYVGDPLAGLRPPTFPTNGTPCAGPHNDQPTTAAGAEGCTFNGSTTYTLSPGIYYGGWHITGSNVSITLEPGIYVIAGGGITQTGGTLSSAGGRVLIYSTDDPFYAAACKASSAPQPNTDCQGELNLTGGNVNLTGLDRDTPCPPASLPTLAGCPFGGLLIWQAGDGSDPTAPVKVAGSSSLYLSGTIYAPKAPVTLTGNNVTTGCTATSGNYDCAAVQIISDTWNINGGVNLEMPYDPKVLYQLPLKGLVR